MAQPQSLTTRSGVQSGIFATLSCPKG